MLKPGTLAILVCGPLALAAQDPLKPFPQHVAYPPASIQPSIVTQSQMDQAVADFYDAWKDRYLVQGCEPGHYYLFYNYEGGNEPSDAITVSEAHGYGMILSAFMAGYDPDAKAIFDGFHRYFRAHPSVNNPDLMAWQQVTGCVNTPHGDGDASATDGDMDIAYALLLAHDQWGSGGQIDYLGEARMVIAAVLEDDTSPITRTPTLGDWVGPGGVRYLQEDTRPSDFMPSHLRAYHAATGEGAWLDSVEAVYATADYVHQHYSPETGLLPDFLEWEGAYHRPASPGFLETAFDGDYFWNACRTPWRMGLDHLLSGEGRGLPRLRAMNGWFRTATGGNPASVLPGYRLDGAPVGHEGEYLAFIAPLAVSATVGEENQAWLDALWSYVAGRSLDSEDYYGNTLKLLAMLAVSRNWWAPGGGRQPPAVRITSPTEGAAFSAPAQVLIRADASDADGSVTQVAFYEGAALLGTDGEAPYELTWGPVPAGSYSLTAKATDDSGATAVSASVSIQVRDPSHAPAITGASKASAPFRLKVSGSRFQTGCQVRIDGTPAPATAFKGENLVVAKGGSALKALVPTGVTVQVTVLNPDGGLSNAFPFTR